MDSIAATESSSGTNFKNNNPFGLGPGLRFTTPFNAVQAEGATLNKFIYSWNETSVSQLHSGNNYVTSGRWHEHVVAYPGYCARNLGGQAQAAMCQAAGRTVSGLLLEQSTPGFGVRSANPNNLTFPCQTPQN